MKYRRVSLLKSRLDSRKFNRNVICKGSGTQRWKCIAFIHPLCFVLPAYFNQRQTSRIKSGLCNLQYRANYGGVTRFVFLNETKKFAQMELFIFQRTKKKEEKDSNETNRLTLEKCFKLSS